MMAEKNKSVPELRFPGFVGEWSHAPLGTFTKTLTSGSRDWSQYYSNSGSKFIRMTNLSRNGIQLLLDDLRYVALPEDSSEGERTSLETDDILISITAELGKIGCIPPDFGIAYINQHTALVRLNHERASARFVAQLLSSARMNKMINRLNDAGAKAGLNLPTIRSFPLNLPALPEQQKIADFLTAVDGRIGQLIQKKALLEDYKKGVMQQLFTQSIRFKDKVNCEARENALGCDHGNDFPEWEEKRYDAVYSFKNTNSYSRDFLTYEEGEVRNIHYGDIHTKFKSNFVLKNELVPFIKAEVELKRISEDCYCSEGDLVIADASEDYNDVGKCIEIRDLSGERTLAGLHTFIARPKKNAMAPGFGGYLMQSREVRLKIMTIAQGTKVLGISKTQLCKVLLPIPSPAEQTKIADFLSALDRKIASVATQITATQTFKRGLLQQMFV